MRIIIFFPSHAGMFPNLSLLNAPAIIEQGGAGTLFNDEDVEPDRPGQDRNLVLVFSRERRSGLV